MFSAPNFGATQTQSAPPPAQYNNVLENLTAVTVAVSGPELEGDDRDRIVSCLNQLLAACGVGKGYYRKGVAPYDFSTNNPFYRLKAVGYNRLSRHKNSDGLVSLMLKIPATQIQTAAEKQKIIDTINNILRTKPAPPATSSFIMSQQQQQAAAAAAAAGIKIYTDLKSVIAHDAALTEIVINVNEYRRGVWTALDLHAELTKPERANQLKQLQCESVIPLIELNKDDLENYIHRAPPGFEELWPQAVQENPDPTALAPFPIQGFEQLIQRQKQQVTTVANQQAYVKNLIERLTTIESGTCTSHNKYIVCKQNQKHLSFRLLRILAAQTLVQRYGMALDEKEERLRSRLETIQAHLNAPDRLRFKNFQAKIMAIYKTLRNDGDVLRQRAQEHVHADRVLTNNIAGVKRCLTSRQSLLEDLVGAVKASADEIDILDASCDRF